MDIRNDIESWFPKIVGKQFKIIKSDKIFNCVSFTLEIYTGWMWPSDPIWPHKEIPRDSGLLGFKKLYEKYGYMECSSPSYEKEYDKIAFYSKNGIPQHACKQFGNIWRSKLGPAVIIEHELDWLCGNTEDAYGEIAFIMKRKKTK